MGYIEGFTYEAGYCPYCGKNVYTRRSDGSDVCENDECMKKFFVIEDDID